MPDFTEAQIAELQRLAVKADALLEMERSYERAGWLGRLMWKTILTIGATVAAVAAFKEQVISLWPWK